MSELTTTTLRIPTETYQQVRLLAMVRGVKIQDMLNDQVRQLVNSHKGEIETKCKAILDTRGAR